MLEKIKRNWKGIIIFSVFGYFALTVIASACGYSILKEKKREMENHETEIGREFSRRKESFHEKFYAAWEKGFDSLDKKFSRSQKRSDQGSISALKKWIERDPNKFWVKINEEEQQEARYFLALLEQAFAKTWDPQRDDETQEQFKRRQYEGDWDRDQIELAKSHANLKWCSESDFLHRRIESAEELFKNQKEFFYNRYGEDDPYQGVLSQIVQSKYQEDPTEYK